jgi:hypothetical protein
MQGLQIASDRVACRTQGQHAVRGKVNVARRMITKLGNTTEVRCTELVERPKGNSCTWSHKRAAPARNCFQIEAVRLCHFYARGCPDSSHLKLHR